MLMVLVSSVAAKMLYTSRYTLLFIIVSCISFLTATFLKFQSLQIYFKVHTFKNKYWKESKHK